jgi:hypothetical protein
MMAKLLIVLDKEEKNQQELNNNDQFNRQDKITHQYLIFLLLSLI